MIRKSYILDPPEPYLDPTSQPPRKQVHASPGLRSRSQLSPHPTLTWYSIFLEHHSKSPRSQMGL